MKINNIVLLSIEKNIFQVVRSSKNLRTPSQKSEKIRKIWKKILENLDKKFELNKNL